MSGRPAAARRSYDDDRDPLRDKPWSQQDSEEEPQAEIEGSGAEEEPSGEGLEDWGLTPTESLSRFAVGNRDKLNRLSNNGRHASLVVICEWLHQIVVGRAADALLKEGHLPEEGVLWVPPTFAFLHARVHVGRKERGPDGSRLRLPVRVVWADPVVVIASDTVPELNVRDVPSDGPGLVVTWTVDSMGHSGTGDAHIFRCAPGRLAPSTGDNVDASTTRWQVAAESAAGIPQRVLAEPMTKFELISELQALASAGSAARWEFLQFLEPRVTKELHRAHAALSGEIGRFRGQDITLLDATKLESLRDLMILGDGENPGMVYRMVERLLDPAALRKCEPLRYLMVALGRDAKETVRQAIADPRIGAQVRRLALELGTTDVETIVAVFRKRNPRSRLSTERAGMALSVDADTMSSWRFLEG